ncbi:alpha-amylase family glycosyl hydrolase [Roseivivax sediminis]|uniref:Alpha-glucosidase n=1 Tax=Roseivivax sediminis TaxID=936889 RepID=A0A1I1W4X8_9RHOB|nr:alpha-amylase family glycosyl hydrolase [Roseivivax sediminis]SFD88383.1 alpha-glucosidase [Roseivivax sediminis]
MSDQEWWRGAVIYQIYPRSFQDDNADGFGDLAGITRRLPHVADLGVEAIWLSPVFPSPMADMGYDVSDHRDIDPSFGTLAEFDGLVARAHGLGLRVLIDQVLSHSSDRHPFFTESRASRDNPRADWYLWADPKPDGMPPNNWQAVFGGPAWEWDVRRKQYYFHTFLKEQPDFDFNNGEVQAWALDTLRFWLDRGVDGFRLDAVNHYLQDPHLRDNPVDWREKTEPDYKTYEMQFPQFSKNRPENLPFMEDMRALLDSYDARVFVGEVGESHYPAERLADYTAPGRLHMAYTPELMGEKFSAAHVRRQIEWLRQEAPDSWPCWAFSNHDVPRHMTRWARFGQSEDALARLCAALLLSLEGSVCLYQGEELGLPQADLDYHELVDPEGRVFWPDNKGRDGSRTPMPWEGDAPHGGFSQAEETWLPVKPPHLARALDRHDPEDGIPAFYARMIALRRAHPALRTGQSTFAQTEEPVLAFWRGGTHFCAFNLGPDAADADLPDGLTPLLTTDGVAAGASLHLPGNGVFIAQRG